MVDESAASNHKVIPGNSVPAVPEFRVSGAWFTVPVPKLVSRAVRLAVVPVALIIGPFAAIGRLEDEVVKLWEEDAQTPVGAAELLARTR